MSSWREHKRKARADIHRTFQVPAVYLTHAAGAPIRCNVRIHSKVNVNQNEFTWPSTAGHLEIDPYIIFDSAEVSKPLANSYLIAGPREIYRLGVSEPFREAYAKSEMTVLTEVECTNLIASISNLTDEAWGNILV